MSSNSSLSSAKRRRVGLPPTATQLQGQSRPGQQQNALNKRVQIQPQSQIEKQSNTNMNENENYDNATSDFPLLPPPPPGLSINQILSTHHLYVNKIAGDFSVAINELGNTFNMLSANCDNLNERLTAFESEGSSDNNNSVSSNVSVVNEFNLSENKEFISLRNDIMTFKDRLNYFDSEFKEIKELKVLLLKNQGLILDNTLNITNIKSEYSNSLSNIETRVKLLEEELNKRSSSEEGEGCVDEYISNSLSDLVNKALVSVGDLENLDDNQNSSNISLNVYDN